MIVYMEEKYKWIKVKRHEFDPDISWEENYKNLEKHHIEETTFILAEIDSLREKLFDATETNGKLNWYRTAYSDLTKKNNL